MLLLVQIFIIISCHWCLLSVGLEMVSEGLIDAMTGG